MIRIDFELNAQPATLECPAQRRLLSLLREDLGLIGAKPGCDIGRCGACMVWLDGQPVNACLVMAWQLHGRRVTTVEAIAADPESAPVRDALARCGAVQCGYCNPGMLVTMTYLHLRQPRPQAREAVQLMCGNLCRCTGYGGVSRAIDELFGALDVP